MAIAPTFQRYLDQHVTYDVIAHEPTMSSMRTAQVPVVWLPALSSARRPTVFFPSPLICVEAVLPATTITGPLSIQ